MVLGGTPIPLYTTSNREDPVLNATAYVSWNYTDWSRLTGFYRFQGNFTDFVVTTGRASTSFAPLAWKSSKLSKVCAR